MTHKGENYSVKLKKYYFCNETQYTMAVTLLVGTKFMLKKMGKVSF